MKPLKRCICCSSVRLRCLLLSFSYIVLRFTSNVSFSRSVGAVLGCLVIECSNLLCPFFFLGLQHDAFRETVVCRIPFSF